MPVRLITRQSTSLIEPSSPMNSTFAQPRYGGLGGRASRMNDSPSRSQGKREAFTSDHRSESRSIDLPPRPPVQRSSRSYGSAVTSPAGPDRRPSSLRSHSASAARGLSAELV